MFLCKDKSQVRITGLHDETQNYFDYLFISQSSGLFILKDMIKLCVLI